jgi:hypothetical protein
MLTLTALVIGVAGVTTVGATKKGTEGCTPGYWKNHTDSWVGYSSGQAFSSVFDNAFPGKSLLTVLKQPASSGGTNALNDLGRHTVAALLNASSSVDYPYSTADVITMFNNTYPGTDGAYEALKNMFAGFNELGCPLN